MSKIFVSHASADEPVVTLLVKTFLLSCGLSPNDIFYTSVNGTGCTGGSFFNEEIRKNFKEASVIIAYLSKNYRASEYCMAELGATWISAGDKKFVPLLDDSLDESFFKGVLTGCTLNTINDEGSLFDGIQCILETLSLKMPKMSWINDRVDEFLINYPQKKSEVPLPFYCEEKTFKKMEQELNRYKEICREQKEDLRTKQKNIELLEAAKSSKDVIKAKISACHDEKESFDLAVQCVNDETGILGHFMTKYIIYDYFGLDPLYKYHNYADDFEESKNKGYLIIKDEEYRINYSDRHIKRATDSLNNFLDVFNTISKELKKALEDEYDVDFDLSKSTCLDKIFRL